MNYQRWVIIFIVSIFSISCDEIKQPNEGQTTVNKDSTSTIESNTPMQTLRDSADKAWVLMIQSDDQKIKDIGRLLQEITYCKKYNALLLDSLVDVVNTLPEKRYLQPIMKSAEIDAYDELTNVVIARTKYLARTTDELKSHPIAETLYNDIAQADNDVALYRALYDRFATDYNYYLETNPNQFDKSGTQFIKLPLFSLSAI